MIFPSVGVDTNKQTRDRWVKRQLKKLRQGTWLLDAGAGEQQYKKWCSHLRYTATDIANYDGQGNGAALQTQTWNYQGLDIISDSACLPFATGSFGAILCTEVLEHVPDPVRVLEELVRVLKPGGKLLLTSPFASMTHFAPYHFATGFNKYFYEHHLDRLGVEIDQLVPNGNFFEHTKEVLQRTCTIGEKHAGVNFSKVDALSRLILLRYLAKASKKGRKSAEVMCLGYHVLATKRE